MNSISDQRDFYNDHWRDFEYANRLKTARCAAIIYELAALKIYQPEILDLGCGTGWLAGILGTLGPTTGVELSDEAIKQAALRHPYVRFIAANFFELNWPSGTFDVVVSQEVLEHVEDQAGYLTLAYQALKPGGYLILTTPNPRTFTAMPAELRKSWSQQPIEKLVPISDLKEMFRTHFRIRTVTTIVPGYGKTGSYRLVNSPRLRKILGQIGLERTFDYVRGKIGYGLHTLIVAEKPAD